MARLITTNRADSFDRHKTYRGQGPSMTSHAADSAWRLYSILAKPWSRAGNASDCIETILELLAARKRGQLDDEGELTLRTWEKMRHDLSKALHLPSPTDLGRFFESTPGLLEQTRRALASLTGKEGGSGHARAFLRFLMHESPAEFRHTSFLNFKWPEYLTQLTVKLMGKPSRAPLYCPFDSSGCLPLLLASHGWDVCCELENAQTARVLMLFAFVGGWKLSAHVGNAIREPQWVESGKPQRFGFGAMITSFRPRFRDEVDQDRYGRFPVRLHYGGATQLAHLIAQTAGRVMAIMPEGFLLRTAGGEHDYKEQLVRREWLSAVIQLPRDAFAPYANIQTSILMFETDRSQKDVLFVDARTDPIDQILALLDKRRASRLSATASYEEIAAMNFNLSVDRYVRSEEVQQIDMALALDETKTMELLGIADVIRPQTVTGEELEAAHVFVEVGLQDVQPDGSIKTPRKTVHVQETSLSKASRQRLEPDDVLLSVRGRIGTVGIVPKAAKDLVGHPWIASQAFVILRLRRGNPTSPRALYRYLSSPKGQRLLKSLAAGATVPMISIGDVKKLPVIIPSASEQREIEREHEKLRKLRSQIEQLETQVDELTATGWPETKFRLPPTKEL